MTLVPSRSVPSEPPGYRQPHRVHETGLDAVRGWLLVLLALGADLAALRSVLLLLFGDEEWVAALAVIGILAAGVGAAHHAGVQMARARAGDPDYSRRGRDAVIASWLAIGLGATAVRVFLPIDGGGIGRFAAAAEAAGPHLRDVLAAALFLALHLASGIAVMAHTRTHHNPFVRALRRAVRVHDRAVRAEARTRAAAVRARSVLAQQTAEPARERDRWETARNSVVAEGYELACLARELIATGLQDAPATDALTRDPRPELDPPRG
ncbi:hypothetical protein [Pseudonocardia alni]|uniref:hypothetical protein n=1 Tax=Pseudonocardia alni TaxID=33907 RepID=UPI0033D39688